MRVNKIITTGKCSDLIINQILSTSSVRKHSMYGIRKDNLYVDIVTYPNLQASAEKYPLSNSPGMYMYVTVGSPVFAASVPLQIMRRSWSTLMSCGWRPLLGTDTLVSLTGTPTTELRVAMVLGNIPLWCEKEKTRTTMLNTLAREIFLHIII